MANEVMTKANRSTLPSSIWHVQLGADVLSGYGGKDVLSGPLWAFFASRQCSGMAIRLAMDWALAQAAKKQAVVSGFHSPLEQSVLTVLLQAKSPVVAVLARPVSEAKLPGDWLEAVQAGRMAVVSREKNAGRLTVAQAALRNDIAAGLAQKIVIAHASPGGQLERSCELWSQAGWPIERLT